MLLVVWFVLGAYLPIGERLAQNLLFVAAASVLILCGVGTVSAATAALNRKPYARRVTGVTFVMISAYCISILVVFMRAYIGGRSVLEGAVVALAVSAMTIVFILVLNKARRALDEVVDTLVRDK